MSSPPDRILTSSRTPFAFDLALAYFERRAGELVDATEADAYRRLLVVGGDPVLVEARAPAPGETGLVVSVLKGNGAYLAWAAQALRRSFGLDDDLDAFRAAVADDTLLLGLLDRLAGLRLIRTHSAFEALVWAVIGQQINLTFAFRLKSVLVRSYGIGLEHGGRTYWAFPRPQDLAAADPDSLAGTGLGRRKASTIVTAARLIESGELDLEGLARLPRAEADTRLLNLAGVGPWTAQYTLLRGLGDFGAFPASDLGLRVAAGRLYGCDGAAPMGMMRELAAHWGEWRGYAAFYLWNWLAGQPHHSSTRRANFASVEPAVERLDLETGPP